MMAYPYEKEEMVADLAVVGLGVGGLAAALMAARLGRKVIAFTDRDSYIRGQRLYLTDKTIKLLGNFRNTHDVGKKEEDTKFWKRFDAEGTIQTKDIEKYLYRKLVEEPSVRIVHLEKERNPIEALGIGEGDNRASCIKLKDGTQYYCHHIVAADGSRHNFATIASRDLGQEISYVKSPYQDRHLYHAAVLLKLKKGVPPALATFKPLSAKQKIRLFQKHGWDKDYEPNMDVSTNKDRTKFNFTGAIPEAIFREPVYAVRKERLRQWAGEAIFQKFGVRPDKLDYRSSRKNPAKDRLQANVFEVDLMICQNPTLPLPGGGFFTQIGDARRTPYYRLGHGLNHAILGGCLFAQTLSSGPDAVTIEDYQREMCAMDKYIESSMRGMLFMPSSPDTTLPPEDLGFPQP